MKSLISILTLLTLIISLDFSTARGDALPDSAYISGVVGHAQGYTLSCEARSAADWAAYWGVSVSEDEFQNALPTADNPDVGFVGDPSDAWGRIPPHGYGVHAGPVAETLKGFGLDATAHHDLSWDDLREEISAGRPVIVWIIGQMWGGTSVEYQASDGSTARVARFEHTMILVGYSPDSVWVVDGYSGQLQNYWLTSFLSSWSVLGDMAVFGSYETPAVDTPASDVDATTYTIEKGDFLKAIAERFNTTWEELARLNSINWPYTIYPGQVLLLPGADEPSAIQAEPQSESISAPNLEAGSFTAYLPIVTSGSSPTTQPTNPVTGEASGWLTNLCKRVGLDCSQIAGKYGLQLRFVQRKPR